MTFAPQYIIIIIRSDLGRCYRGVEQLVARRAHNPKAVGSSPASATIKMESHPIGWFFFFTFCGAGLNRRFNKLSAQEHKAKPPGDWLREGNARMGSPASATILTPVKLMFGRCFLLSIQPFCPHKTVIHCYLPLSLQKSIIRPG